MQPNASGIQRSMLVYTRGGIAIDIIKYLYIYIGIGKSKIVSSINSRRSHIALSSANANN